MAANRARRTVRSRRQLKQRGLIVTEGEKTEKQYFELLNQYLRSSRSIVSYSVVPACGEPSKVLRECLKKREAAERKDKPYDWYCCVVDVDSHTKLDEVLAQARDEDVHVVVTNPKFELWMLWHKADCSGYVSSNDLDALMEKHQLVDKRNKKHLCSNFPIDKFGEAEERAYKVDNALGNHRAGENPSSAVPILLGLIMNGN